MSSYNEFILHAENLNQSNQIQCDVVLQRSYESTVYGAVLSCDDIPLINAAVSVSKIDYNFNPVKITNMGFTTTNDNGEFAIVIERLEGVYYEFTVYTPLK